MTEDYVLNPGYYILKSLVIESIVGVPSDELEVQRLDISNLVPSLFVTTGIDQTSLMGSFKVIDGVRVLEEFPLRGEERATIVLMDSLQNEQVYDVFCYKIDDVSVSDENGVLSYRVHFISTQTFRANRFSVTKSFRERIISDIVAELFNEYFEPGIGLNKGIVIYPPTDRIVRCIIPSLKPDEAMQFLSKRAYSSQSPSCSFRFFENNRTYLFASDETLYDEAVQGDRIFNFTFYDAIPKDPSYFTQRMNNLNTLVNSKRVNTIDDMMNGAYRNKVHILDTLFGRVNLREPGYNYLETKGAYFRTTSDQVGDRHTSQFADEYFNEEIQKEFLTVKDYMDEDGNPDASLPGNHYLAEIGSNRLAFRKHISSITVEATGPGRFDITAGDIVNLDVKEFSGTKDGTAPEDNKQLSGKYIVKTVNHEMNEDSMLNRYVLIKREWAETTGETNIGTIDLEEEFENILDDFEGVFT